MREIAANRTGIGTHRHGFQAKACEGVEIGNEHAVIGFAGRGLIRIEGIGILHQEFAPAHDAETRPDLVAEFPLDMIEQFGHVLVGAAITAENIRDHFLIGRPVEHVALLAVGDAQHLLAVIIIATAFAPQIGRLQGRHQHFHRTGAILFLAHDLLDLLQDFPAQRQPGVDPGALLADHAGAQHQLMRDNLGIRRGFFQDGQEKSGQAHRYQSRLEVDHN